MTWSELPLKYRLPSVAYKLDVKEENHNQPQSLGNTADAVDLVSSLDGLLLELSRVLLFRDALHVVLPLVVSILRRLRWKTKFVGQLSHRLDPR